MDQFRLFAHGVNFDVDAYVKISPLEFDEIWHLGEGYYKSSGISKSLGDGTPLPILKQDQLALEFLGTHRDTLRELAQYPGVDTFILGLCYETELAANVTGFCLGPTEELMWHCLNVGARLVYYVELDRQQDIEAAVTALFGDQCALGTTGNRPPRKTKVPVQKRRI